MLSLQGCGLIPGLTQGSGIATSFGIGHRCGLDPVLLWLWCRPQVQLGLEAPPGSSIWHRCGHKGKKFNYPSSYFLQMLHYDNITYETMIAVCMNARIPHIFLPCSHISYLIMLVTKKKKNHKTSVVQDSSSYHICQGSAEDLLRALCPLAGLCVCWRSTV